MYLTHLKPTLKYCSIRRHDNILIITFYRWPWNVPSCKSEIRTTLITHHKCLSPFLLFHKVPPLTWHALGTQFYELRLFASLTRNLEFGLFGWPTGTVADLWNTTGPLVRFIEDSSVDCHLTPSAYSAHPFVFRSRAKTVNKFENSRSVLVNLDKCIGSDVVLNGCCWKHKIDDSFWYSTGNTYDLVRILVHHHISWLIYPLIT